MEICTKLLYVFFISHNVCVNIFISRNCGPVHWRSGCYDIRMVLQIVLVLGRFLLQLHLNDFETGQIYC